MQSNGTGTVCTSHGRKGSATVRAPHTTAAHRSNVFHLLRCVVNPPCASCLFLTRRCDVAFVGRLTHSLRACFHNQPLQIAYFCDALTPMCVSRFYPFCSAAFCCPTGPEGIFELFAVVANRSSAPTGPEGIFKLYATCVLALFCRSMRAGRDSRLFAVVANPSSATRQGRKVFLSSEDPIWLSNRKTDSTASFSVEKSRKTSNVCCFRLMKI